MYHTHTYNIIQRHSSLIVCIHSSDIHIANHKEKAQKDKEEAEKQY